MNVLWEVWITDISVIFEWLYYVFVSMEVYSTLSIIMYFIPVDRSLWPSDAIWRHKSGSTLAQVMVCCLWAPNNYLKQSNIDLPEVLCGIQLREISQFYTLRKILNLPGTSELNNIFCFDIISFSQWKCKYCTDKHNLTTQFFLFTRWEISPCIIRGAGSISSQNWRLASNTGERQGEAEIDGSGIRLHGTCQSHKTQRESTRRASYHLRYNNVFSCLESECKFM